MGVVILTGSVLFLRGWTDRASPVPSQPMERRGADLESNGAIIYHTGFDEDGNRIPASGGPPWLYQHGRGCAACHGPDGSGGEAVMMSFAEAPNIQYEHLTDEMEHGEGEEYPPCDKELIKRAITEGLDPAGEPLDRTMPRWQLDPEDLQDLIEYLQTLGH